MSKICISLITLIFFLNSNAFSQTTAKKADNGLVWYTSLQEVHELSTKSNKPIFAFFTGSDWCGWCKRLTASVFSKDEFKTWAEKNVVLLELDFPRRKTVPQNIQAQNANLQQAFQVSGYPTIWVFHLNKDEAKNQYTIEALGKTGYTATVQEFTSGVEQMIKK